jgi:regulator of cell morphogenesis and NO signaling
MKTVQIHDTVGTIIRDRPFLSRLFEDAKVDYCCGGKKTLEEACQSVGLDPQAFLLKLEDDNLKQAITEVNFAEYSLTELADHIEHKHHTYLHQELPRLEKMVTKVAKVHGQKDPRLLKIQVLFLELSAELSTHLGKEEQILFPIIRQLETSHLVSEFQGFTVANPIHCMEFEHDQAGEVLRQLRKLTDDYTPPEWACNTYRTLLDALQTFEEDMHQHIHKENNLLFPRAVALEQEKAQDIYQSPLKC